MEIENELELDVQCLFQSKQRLQNCRLWVVPHFSSGVVERAKITPREKKRGVIFTRARVSLALLSLRKNGGLLVV